MDEIFFRNCIRLHWTKAAADERKYEWKEIITWKRKTHNSYRLWFNLWFLLFYFAFYFCIFATKYILFSINTGFGIFYFWKQFFIRILCIFVFVFFCNFTYTSLYSFSLLSSSGRNCLPFVVPYFRSSLIFLTESLLLYFASNDC